METVWQFPLKLKSALPHDLANSLLGIYLPKENKNINSRWYIHTNVHCKIFIITKIRKQSKCPSIGEWINIWDTHTHTMEYDSTRKKHLPFATTWMDLEGIRGFPGDSDSKESACNAGHLGSIPGLERSPGKGNGTSILAWRIPWIEI